MIAPTINFQMVADFGFLLEIKFGVVCIYVSNLFGKGNEVVFDGQDLIVVGGESGAEKLKVGGGGAEKGVW